MLRCYCADLEHENDGFGYYYFLKRAVFVSKIKRKTTTQNQKSESATKRCFLKYLLAIAVEHPGKTIFEEHNSCKKSDFGPANQHNTNIPHKYFPESTTTGEGIYSAEKKTCSKILLICRVITMAASEKPNIVADSKIAKNKIKR